MNEWDAHLARWVEAGLVSPAQADAVRAFESNRTFEADHQAVAAPLATAPDVGSLPATAPAAPRALAMVGEVLGYLGAVLVVVAVSFLVGQRWGSLEVGGRIALVASLLAVVTGAGVVAARAAAAPSQRLASVLLAASVGLTGWCTWVIGDNLLRWGDVSLARSTTLAMAVVACTIAVLRPRAVAHLVLLATLAALASAIVAPWMENGDSPIMGAVWMAMGIAWVGLAAARVLVPAPPALVAGGLLSLLGTQVASSSGWAGWVLAAGIVIALASIGASLRWHRLKVLIIPGALTLLVCAPALIHHLFGEAMATWMAVLVTGLGLVGAAIALVRTRHPEPH